MLKKVVSVKNVGRLKNCSAAGNVQLNKFVMVLGANGFGKSTLCSILRSVQSGDGTHILGRKSLGSKGDPEVSLLANTNTVMRFNEGEWSGTLPDIAIFDGVFLAENVFSGDAVELDHKRKLYRVIVGRNGVSLAEEEARLAVDCRNQTTEVTNATAAVQAISGGLTPEEYLKVPKDTEIDSKIAEQEKTVEAVRQSEQLTTRPLLAELSVPSLAEDFSETLMVSIDGIGSEVEQRLKDHLATHHMDEGGESWLSDGIPYVTDDACPFCGQPVPGDLLTAFRTLFSDYYLQLKADVAGLKKSVEERFSDAAVERMQTMLASNKAAVEFWQKYCTLETSSIRPTTPWAAVTEVREAALHLLERKSQSPLDLINSAQDTALNTALKNLACLNNDVLKCNTGIRAANTIIRAKQASSADANLRREQDALARLRAVKLRHDEPGSLACERYQNATAKKDELENRREDVRKKLTAHTKNVVKPYQGRINQLLDNFNAGFRITQTKHAYPGGVATSSYQLVIDDTPVELGDGKTALTKPSFKNTLSAGDRTTLGLAFFLAHIEQDPK